MNQNKSVRKNGIIQGASHVSEVFSGIGVYYLGPFSSNGVRQKSVFATFYTSGVGVVQLLHSGQKPDVADEDLQEVSGGSISGGSAEQTLQINHGDTCSIARVRIHIMQTAGRIDLNFLQEARNI